MVNIYTLYSKPQPLLLVNAYVYLRMVNWYDFLHAVFKTPTVNELALVVGALGALLHPTAVLQSFQILPKIILAFEQYLISKQAVLGIFPRPLVVSLFLKWILAQTVHDIILEAPDVSILILKSVNSQSVFLGRGELAFEQISITHGSNLQLLILYSMRFSLILRIGQIALGCIDIRGWLVVVNHVLHNGA